MKLEHTAGLLAIGLFVAMVIAAEVGRWMTRRNTGRGIDTNDDSISRVDAAVFGLLGLLLGFTFAGASMRFDSRRDLVVEEANDVGTAYLRLDLLPEASQPALRDSFRRYLDLRIETYRRLPDLGAAMQVLAESGKMQQVIWQQATAACRQAPPSAAILLLPALNSMFDITTTRTMAAKVHPPWVILYLLCGLALASALFAGQAMAPNKRRSWIHFLGFPFIVALSVYVIIDLEFPRMGLITMHEHDQVLVDLRKSMD